MSPRPPALQGMRVFDLSQGVAGPCCTLLMAAQGADVIKVEPPGGDWLRHGHTQVRGQPPASLAVNAGKRSLSLDLSQADARQVARQVAVACDNQITALYAYQAVASALIRRLRFGGGEAIEVTLAGAMATFLAPRIISHVISDGMAGHTEFLAPTGEYETADGILMIAVLKGADVERLFSALGHSNWLADPRFATAAARLEHAKALRAELDQLLLKRTSLQWESELSERGVMACAVRDIGGFVAAQAQHGLALVETTSVPGLGDCPLVRIPGAPAWSSRDPVPRPPTVGEHGRAILAEAGIAPDQAEQVLRSAVSPAA